MDDQTQLWNHYQNLRDEIRGADALNYQIMGLVVGACAAILVAGFNQTNLLLRCLIFLCIYVVSYPGYQLLYSSRRRIWRISTYMRVFLEPELKHVKWETRLLLQRKQELENPHAKGLSSLILKNEWFIITAINSIALIAIIAGFIQYYYVSERTLRQIFLAVFPGAIALLAYLYICISTAKEEKALRRSGQIETNFYDSWEKIKEEEGKKVVMSNEL